VLFIDLPCGGKYTSFGAVALVHAGAACFDEAPQPVYEQKQAKSALRYLAVFPYETV
jgi:hypothetical protein